MSESPTYSLDTVRELLRSGALRVTQRARRDGLSMGFDAAHIVAVVAALRSDEFCSVRAAS